MSLQTSEKEFLSGKQNEKVGERKNSRSPEHTKKSKRLPKEYQRYGKCQLHWTARIPRYKDTCMASTTVVAPSVTFHQGEFAAFVCVQLPALGFEFVFPSTALVAACPPYVDDCVTANPERSIQLSPDPDQPRSSARLSPHACVVSPGAKGRTSATALSACKSAPLKVARQGTPSVHCKSTGAGPRTARVPAGTLCSAAPSTPQQSAT